MSITYINDREWVEFRQIMSLITDSRSSTYYPSLDHNNYEVEQNTDPGSVLRVINSNGSPSARQYDTVNLSQQKAFERKEQSDLKGD